VLDSNRKKEEKRKEERKEKKMGWKTDKGRDR
jgi:hypothetical protein